MIIVQEKEINIIEVKAEIILKDQWGEMANVACLCGVTHSMIGAILKTLNQAVSELQCLHDGLQSSGRKETASQNSKNNASQATGSASVLEAHWLHGHSENDGRLWAVLTPRVQRWLAIRDAPHVRDSLDL